MNSTRTASANLVVLVCILVGAWSYLLLCGHRLIRSERFEFTVLIQWNYGWPWVYGNRNLVAANDEVSVYDDWSHIAIAAASLDDNHASRKLNNSPNDDSILPSPWLFQARELRAFRPVALVADVLLAIITVIGVVKLRCNSTGTRVRLSLRDLLAVIGGVAMIFASIKPHGWYDVCEIVSLLIVVATFVYLFARLPLTVST